MKLLFNATGGINGYDQYGHYLRAWLLPNSACTTLFTGENESCVAHFNEAGQGEVTADPTPKRLAPPSKAQLKELRARLKAAQAQERVSGSTGMPLDAYGDPVGGDGGSAKHGATDFPGARHPSIADARALLDTVIGRQRETGGGR